MKRAKTRRFNELQLDVIEYMFVEWLCRQGVYSAFESNYKNIKSTETSFRAALRDQIRYVVFKSDLDVDDLVSSSFSFAKAPEGFVFWSEVSTSWRLFCFNFQKLF
jgi:uncharacterized protein (DUF2225 family)